MAKPSVVSALPSQVSPTSTAKIELHTLTQLLHLIHHRNKNQHRLLKWYKQFSILRRNIQKLYFEVEKLETAEKFSSKGGKGEKYVGEAREVVEARVEFLEVRVMGEAYLAFSTVVKDLQYAHLGVMLLGMLARIRTVIRKLGKENPESDEEESEEVISSREYEQAVEPAREDEEIQDLGEVVSRDELETSRDEARDEHEEEEINVAPKTPKVKRPKVDATSPLDSASETRPKKRSKEEKKKKKRKRGDAFDDLFDSLI